MSAHLCILYPKCRAYVTPCTGFETANPVEPADCLWPPTCHLSHPCPQLKLDLSDDAPLRQIGFLIEEYAVQSAEDTMRSSIDSSAANLRINYDGFTQV